MAKIQTLDSKTKLQNKNPTRQRQIFFWNVFINHCTLKLYIRDKVKVIEGAAIENRILPVIRATTANVPTELWRDVANSEYAKQEKSSECHWIKFSRRKLLIWTKIHLNSDSTGQIPVKNRLSKNGFVFFCTEKKLDYENIQ